MIELAELDTEMFLEKGFEEIVGLGSLYVLPIYIITLELIGEKESSRMLLAASIINSIIVHGLKHLFAAPRPPGAGEMLTYSFPSGHAATAFMVAAVLGMKYKGLRYWFIAVASLVAVGRVVIGVHFVRDVIAGALIGFLIGTLVVWKIGKFLPNKFIPKDA